MNEEALRTFWYFVNERHSIFLKKKDGLPKPWSRDPIFQEWKFCNTFRQNDRQTTWLIDNVYSHRMTPELILFNTIAFRAFNWHQTFEALLPIKSIPFLSSWHLEDNKKKLAATLDNGEKFVSGAYMTRGRQGMPKWESLLITLNDVWQEKSMMIKNIGDNSTLEHTYDVIRERKFWGWGEFQIYQFVLDLSYTPICWHASDINDWCVFGPGAERGIEIIYPGIKKKEYLTRAKELLTNQSIFREEHVPPLNLQDIEFCLCELQKYWRIKNGGRSKERYNGTA